MSSRVGSRAAIAVVLGLGLAGSSSAVELTAADTKLLPASSHLLFGLDVKAFVNSTLYQKIAQQAKEKNAGSSSSDPLEELRQKTGLDPAKDIDRLIVGADGGPGTSTGVAVIEGRFDAARLGTYLVKEKGVTVVPVGTRKLYVSAADGPGKPETAAVVYDAGRMLVGSRPLVEKALAGAGAGLDLHSPLIGLAGRVRPGTVLWLVVDDKVLAQASGDQAPGGFKLPPLKALVVSADVAPDLTLNLEGDAVDSTGAANLADMLKGFSAMMAMQAQQKPEMARLAQALTVSSEATRVSVSLRLPYDLIESLTKGAMGGGSGPEPAMDAAPAPAPKSSAKPAPAPRKTSPSPKP